MDLLRQQKILVVVKIDVKILKIVSRMFYCAYCVCFISADWTNFESWNGFSAKTVLQVSNMYITQLKVGYDIL